jgi:hypothetical protein
MLYRSSNGFNAKDFIVGLSKRPLNYEALYNALDQTKKKTTVKLVDFPYFNNSNSFDSASVDYKDGLILLHELKGIIIKEFVQIIKDSRKSGYITIYDEADLLAVLALTFS